MAFDFTVTFGNLLTIIGMVGAMALAWFRLAARIEQVRAEAGKWVSELRIEIMRQHPTVDQLMDAERRHTAAVQSVERAVEGLRGDIMRLLEQRGPRSRSRSAE